MSSRACDNCLQQLTINARCGNCYPCSRVWDPTSCPGHGGPGRPSAWPGLLVDRVYAVCTPLVPLFVILARIPPKGTIAPGLAPVQSGPTTARGYLTSTSLRVTSRVPPVIRRKYVPEDQLEASRETRYIPGCFCSWINVETLRPVIS